MSEKYKQLREKFDCIIKNIVELKADVDSAVKDYHRFGITISDVSDRLETLLLYAEQNYSSTKPDIQENIEKVLRYCRLFDVEINFSPEGIGLWSYGDKLGVSIGEVDVDEVDRAVTALVDFRGSGWEAK